MFQREKISDKNATLSCIQTENAAVDFFRGGFLFVSKGEDIG